MLHLLKGQVRNIQLDRDPERLAYRLPRYWRGFEHRRDGGQGAGYNQRKAVIGRSPLCTRFPSLEHFPVE